MAGRFGREKMRRQRKLDEAMKAAREGRGATPMPKATPAPRRTTRATRAPVRQPRVTAAQRVPSITEGTQSRAARMAEIERRMREIMASETTPDRR